MIGSVTLGGIAAFVKGVNDGVDALNDIKDATGSSIENISALEDVGRRTGASLETVGSVLIKFNDLLSKATPKSDIALQLKAIGLEAEELKKLDPAEALRVTAVALSGYADDANKARLIQDLFGKSVKEAAPFLADLAEKGALVAKVTTAQAEEADKFNKELFTLQANAAEAARSLAGPMVEAINEVAKAFRDGSAAGKSFWEISWNRYQQGNTARWNILRGAVGMDPLNTGGASGSWDAGGASGSWGDPEPAAAGKPSIKLGKTAAQIAADAAAAKKAAEEQKKALVELGKTYAELNGLSSSYYEDLAKYQQQRAAGTLTEEQYVKAVELLISKQPFAIALQKDETEATKARVAAYHEAAKALAAELQERQRRAAMAQGDVQRLRDEEEAAAMAASSSMSLAQALQTIAIARLEEERAKLIAKGTDADTLLAIQNEIDARKELLGLLGQKGVREENKKAADEAAKDWERTAQTIGDTLQDYIMGGGRDAAQYLKRLFATLVLQPLVKFGVSGVLGAFGMGGGDAAGGGSGFGGLLNMASSANSAYSMWSGGFGGTAVGQGWAGYTGATLSPGMVGPSATPVTMWSQAGNAASGAGMFSGGGGSLGAFAGYAAVAAVVLNALGAFRSERIAGNGLTGTLGGEDLEAYALWRQGGTLFSGPRYSTKSPGEEVRKYEAEIAALKGKGAGNYDLEAVYELEVQLKYLKDTYGDQIEAAKKQSDAIQTAFGAMRDNVGNMADVLGLSSEAVRRFTMALGTDLIHPDTGGYGLNFSGLSEDEIAAKVEQALLTANNTLAEQVIGSWRTITEEVRTVRQLSSGYSNDTGYERPAFDEDVRTVTRQEYVESEFARDGEKAIDTLTRLATSLTVVNGVLGNLGETLYASSLAGGDMASMLLDLFGGVENFSAATGAYFQNFFSPEEQRAAVQQQLQAQLDTVDLELPDINAADAREQYRQLIEQQDRTTEEGRKTWAMLVQLAGAFAGVTAEGESAAAKEIDRQKKIADQRASLEERLLIANGDERGALDLRRKQEFDALYELDPALAKMISQIWELEDASEAAGKMEAARGTAMRDLSDAMGRAREGWENQLTALDTQRQLQQESLGLITGIFSMVRTNAQELYGQVESTAAMQAQQGNAFITQALAVAGRTGYLPDREALQEAISAARGGLDATEFGSQTEEDFARLVLANQLKGLEEISGKQKTVAEEQLDRLDTQTEALNKLIRDQQKEFDLLQRQIDIENGTYNATLTVAEATAKIIELLGGKAPAGVGSGATNGSGAVWGGSASGAGSGSGPAATETSAPKYRRLLSLGTAGVGYEGITDKPTIDRLDRLAPVYHAFDGTGDVPGLREAMIAAGGTLDDLTILSGNWKNDWLKELARWNLPAFEVGTNYVPRTMVAQIHEGEAILPRPFNPWAGGANPLAGSGGSDAMLERIEDRLQRLESLQADGNRGIWQFAEQFDNWTMGGSGAGRVEIVGTPTVVMENA
ncbi:MAG: hypothetical protein EOO32_00190 [Comamonadaceae bacterium]|nr:MAG: hypothetical protein EOO32_00190 [Comamonadaceae bacterium]